MFTLLPNLGLSGNARDLSGTVTEVKQNVRVERALLSAKCERKFSGAKIETATCGDASPKINLGRLAVSDCVQN